jgi:hypothetical protein
MMFGPFILIPAMASVNTMSFVVSGDRRRRLAVIVIGCAAVVAPLLLQIAHILPSPIEFKDGGMFLASPAFDIRPVPTIVFLAIATIGTIVTGSIVVARFRDALVKTEQRLYFHTWLLRQFLPDRAYDNVVPGKATTTTSLRRQPAKPPPPTS